MKDLTGTARDEATAQRVEEIVDGAMAILRPKVIALVLSLVRSGETPDLFRQFEWSLFGLVRDLGRDLLERVVNSLEGDGSFLSQQVLYDNQVYRRLGKKTRNAYVATLFGTICVWRFPYRFGDRQIPQTCIFPLELNLGLIASVTPALAEQLGKYLADAGASQRRALAILQEQHGVSMGVKRLRNFLAELSVGVSAFREVTQVEVLLDALRQANHSSGNRKPVLVVGRDGTTYCQHVLSLWQVGAVASVFDRQGKRITTVYLARHQEFGQATLSQMLTNLLTETLTRWEGPLPTLAYVTDSGDNETTYFSTTLQGMLHPRTGQPLHWERVVDFYHTAIRVWVMAECLFGANTPQAKQWAKRMLHNLRHKSRGAKRVLHSAATFAKRRHMSKVKRVEFQKAYRYIQSRTRWMNYVELKRRHIPIGSGITEAACKIIFTQRLKLSGMRWSREGAQHILDLRAILLSGTWSKCCSELFKTSTRRCPTPYHDKPRSQFKIAA
jgi:hypothetical protein